MNKTVNQQPDANRAAKNMAIGITAVLFILVTWHVLTDRIAPSSSSGAIKAYVTQLSPNVAGQVTEVFVADGDVVTAGTPYLS
ncbi:biotin/lipoyl-binding protein [Bermanella marisrubri]|uniref:biotin/lipoyl-binding protein n=1 Tax=Bermanella marisrubri TaxID=207949 RepID=UPI00105A9ECA|nr:biotin/lipoyl-binding protein [Bermanella marisrubri]QIZ84442.1 biotin/lipoyl-binding protein [Bermanella marisrubri]